VATSCGQIDEQAPNDKVFGVGMQRTGTSTMTRAFRLLGYRSAHFPAELWEDREARVLSECNAFFDNPIPLIYQELDERYPASKFILTVRDEEDWLKSVEYPFSEKRDDYGLDESKRIQEMHHALYGMNHFDAEVFRKAFRRHNNQVKEYFADRPDDLLVLDISQDDKWTPLCSFLEIDHPNEPFPHKHSSGLMDRIIRKMRKEAGALKRSILGESP
jgi:hypothetical protein